MPTVLPQEETTPTNARRAEGRARVLLKRRSDGYLGMGIKGGKEYNSPIIVYSLEPGSQGEMQVGLFCSRLCEREILKIPKVDRVNRTGHVMFVIW